MFTWREGIATRLDRALFRVLGNEVLIVLAATRPSTEAELGKIRGIGAENAGRRGGEILDAIRRGLAVPDRDLPSFERRPRFRPDPAFEARLERLKTWRTPTAIRYDLPPGLIAPNGTLEAVARAAPRSEEELLAVPGIRRWQVGEFGADLLALIA